MSSDLQKHLGNNIMGDAAPLLTVTPLYGTAEPEIVTFDETQSPPITAAVAATVVSPANASAEEEDDPLLIQSRPSVDYSAAQSDKSEEPVYRDVPFAILFWVQFFALITLGCTIAPKGYSLLDIASIKEEIREDPSTTSSDLQNFETFVSFMASYLQVYPERILMYLFYPASLMAFLFALVVTTKLIRPHSRLMVALCLVGIFVDTAAIFLVGLITSFSIGGLIFAVVVLGATAYYVRAAWRLIPYSAVNLGVSLEGMQSNCGVYLVALCLAEAGFFFTAYWGYTLVGTMIYVGETQCSGNTDSDNDCAPQSWTFLLLLLSFYWTSQVITNTIQVTVAGVMATWCFDYSFARNCCSSAVWESVYRSLTYSFGSICLGSLLLGIVKVLRYFVNSAKQQRDSRSDQCEGGEVFLCILDCLIQLFEEVFEYFNHWSFVFCGIYGYSYLQSGRMVMELFKARGWTTIVTDDIIHYVLGFTTFSVGIFTGLCSVILERTIDTMIEPDEYDSAGHSGKTADEAGPWDFNVSFLFGPLPNPPLLAFGSGFLIGMIVCSIMMSVVRGAVNTLIVCWADSPSRLEENHPEATKEMADAISGSTSGPFVICWSSRRLTHSASSPDSSLATSA